MSDHPRTIDNGGGEELTFLGIRTDERGEYRSEFAIAEVPAPVQPVTRTRPA